MKRENSLTFRNALICAAAAVLVFLLIAPASASAASKARFTYKKVDQSKTYYNVIEFQNYFKYPKLKGKSKAVKKINSTLKNEANAFVVSVYRNYSEDDIAEYAKSVADSGYTDPFINTASGKVTYNKKGVISIRYSKNWYLGGVYQADTFGDTFSLKTGKRLRVLSVVAKKYAKAGKLRKAIASKLRSKYGYDVQSSFNTRYAANKDLKNVAFYLSKKGKVVVCFPKYDIAAGYMGALTVTLPSKF